MGNKYGYNGAGGGVRGGGGGFDMNSLMKQAKQMQQMMEDAKSKLEEMELTGTAGGGLVEVVVNGQRTVLSVKIKPEACDPDDVEMLEDLILAAINDACAKAQEAEEALIPANVRGLM